MLSQTFFARLCWIILTAMERDKDIVFGGLNVIIVGDFHQWLLTNPLPFIVLQILNMIPKTMFWVKRYTNNSLQLFS